MPEIALSTRPADQETDALALFVAAGDDGPVLLDGGGLPEAARTHLLDAMRQLRAKGKADEVARFAAVPGLAAAVVITTGVGSLPSGGDGPDEVDDRPADDAGLDGGAGLDEDAGLDEGAGQSNSPENALVPTEALRRAAGCAARACSGRERLGLLAPDRRPEALAAIAQGAALGAYRFVAHRGEKSAASLAKEGPVPAIDVLTGSATGSDTGDNGNNGNDNTDAAEEVAAAVTVGRWQAWARDLVNTAPNVLYPESFAERATHDAPRGVTIDVLDEDALAEDGFGGIVGVGQGSARPPRLVTMSYEPDGAQGRLAFVGKGITFDSGGLCIKPPKSMITMKCDMGGAAAVAAAVCAVAELGLPIAVTGYLCLAENMPGSNAQRPGDVVTIRDGQTVEIINTDAEGRMVLVDGIALASESGPDAIVDVATLTGAAMVALGNRTAAVFANDDELLGELTSAATTVGETVWPMPIAEEIRSAMDSQVADIAHTGAAMGGAMTAAAFLRAFVGPQAQGGRPIPWGHLDIAGPAFNESAPHGYTGKGGTGFAVRTLVQFARERSEA